MLPVYHCSNYPYYPIYQTSVNDLNNFSIYQNVNQYLGISQETCKSESQSEEESLEGDELFNTHTALWNDNLIQSKLNNSFIKETNHDPIEMIDVSMSEYYITEKAYLGTIGVSTCYAICAISLKPKPTLMLHHLSVVNGKPIEILTKMIKRLEKYGCSQESIKIYIVGGVIDSNDPDVTEVGLKTQIDFCQLALDPKYKIEGMKFNISKEEYPLDVYININGVYYSKGNLIKNQSNDNLI